MLLDSHALYWLVTGAKTPSETAFEFILEAQIQRRLFVSAITAWELAVAAKKKTNPMVLDMPAQEFMRKAVGNLNARTIMVTPSIALAAAKAVEDLDHKDPGDSFLIATARVRKIPLLTSDAKIQQFGAAGYLQVVHW